MIPESRGIRKKYVIKFKKISKKNIFVQKKTLAERHVTLFGSRRTVMNLTSPDPYINLEICFFEKNLKNDRKILFFLFLQLISRLQVRAISPSRPSSGRPSSSPVRQVRFADGPDNGPAQFDRQTNGRDRRDGPTSTPFPQRGGTFTRPFRGSFIGPRRSAGQFYSSKVVR